MPDERKEEQHEQENCRFAGGPAHGAHHVPGFPEMTKDEKIAAITEVVKAYIAGEGFNFDYDDENDDD